MVVAVDPTKMPLGCVVAQCSCDGVPVGLCKRQGPAWGIVISHERPRCHTVWEMARETPVVENWPSLGPFCLMLPAAGKVSVATNQENCVLDCGKGAIAASYFGKVIFCNLVVMSRCDCHLLVGDEELPAGQALFVELPC